MESVYIEQLRVNTANPRYISNAKFAKLVESIIVFPKMLHVRPIVIDETKTVLGGNMRLRALRTIADMDEDMLRARLQSIRDAQRLAPEGREAIVDYWTKWMDAPIVPVISVSDMTDEQKKQFIIKDNASFGQWDYDKLSSEWDAQDLNAWGLDVWADTTPSFAPETPSSGQASATQTETREFDTSTLPKELQNLDLTPDDLPKIQGDDERPCERIIITFHKEQADQVAAFCGLEKITQVVYDFDALPAANTQG